MTTLDTTPTRTTAHVPAPLALPTVCGADDTFDLVTFDLYRDVHKGLRAELFALTGTAGNLDPSDCLGRAALAAHIGAIAAVLDSHARHEDDAIEPALHVHAPQLAERVATDHLVLERRFARIVDVARSFEASTGDRRRLGHLLYLELTAFTSGYLAHQIVEERVVMPLLERSVGVEAVLSMHGAILAAISPDEMAASLAFMLPAMHLDDRAEMLEGMRATAPAAAVAGVVGLARSVLEPADFTALADRLQLA